MTSQRYIYIYSLVVLSSNGPFAFSSTGDFGGGDSEVGESGWSSFVFK